MHPSIKSAAALPGSSRPVGFHQRLTATPLRWGFQFFILILLFTSQLGCSTYHQKWSEAKKLPPQGFEGAWDGRWISDVNGHNGRLRCVIEPVSGTRYRADFKAHYLGFLRFRHAAILEVTATNGVQNFKGTANLGYFAGGVYSYEGSSTPSNFFSTYKSRHDHGRFEVQLP